MFNEVNLYIWDSEYLQGWSYGTIIVGATSLESARLIAISEFKSYDERRNDLDYDEIDGDPDSIKERFDVFMKDIGQEPSIVPYNTAIFIEGSD